MIRYLVWNCWLILVLVLVWVFLCCVIWLLCNCWRFLVFGVGVVFMGIFGLLIGFVNCWWWCLLIFCLRVCWDVLLMICVMLFIVLWSCVDGML